MQQQFNSFSMVECSDDGLNALSQPAQAFEHPSDVVNAPDLTLDEKRAIFSSWAPDACAIEAAPTLRCIPEKKGHPLRLCHGCTPRTRQKSGRKAMCRSPARSATAARSQAELSQ